MTEVLRIETDCRFHLGLLPTATSGRAGGVGLMLNASGWSLLVRKTPGNCDLFAGDPRAGCKLRTFVSELRAAAGKLERSQSKHLSFQIESTIPTHQGLGSGTQLACAVAVAFEDFAGLPFDQTLRLLRRGRRSLVGVAGFARGGFLYDPGCESEFEQQENTSNVVREVAPESWRIVLVTPGDAEGVSGEREAGAFRDLPPPREQVRAQLREVIERMMLPALGEGRFAEFATAARELNVAVGDHYAPVQGGRFAHPLIRELDATLSSSPWPNLIQSSWGPTAGILCGSIEDAEQCRDFLADRLGDRDILRIAAISNRAARCKTLMPTDCR